MTDESRCEEARKPFNTKILPSNSAGDTNRATRVTPRPEAPGSKSTKPHLSSLQGIEAPWHHIISHQLFRGERQLHRPVGAPECHVWEQGEGAEAEAEHHKRPGRDLVCAPAPGDEEALEEEGVEADDVEHAAVQEGPGRQRVKELSSNSW